MSDSQTNCFEHALSLAELQDTSSASCYDPKAESIYLPYPVVLLLFAIVSWVGSFLLIVGFIVYKNLRKPPGDIILGISIAELILNTHWILSAFYSRTFPGNTEDLANNCTFCMINAVFAVTAGFLEFLYNLSFLIFLIQSLTNAIKPSRVFHKAYHVVSILGSLLALIVLAFFGKLGKTLFGTCSIKWTASYDILAYFGPVIVTFYAIITASTSYQIRKILPESPQSKKSVAHFLFNYIEYIICSTIIWLIFAICNVLVASLAHKITEEQTEPEYFKLISTIGNVAKLANPFALTVIRYQDKTIQSTMRRLLFFWSKTKGREEEIHRPSSSPNQGFSVVNQTNAINLEIGLRSDTDFQEEHTSEVVTKYLRIQTAYSILSGIIYTYREIKYENISIKPKEVVLNPEGFLEAKVCEVSKDIIRHSFPELNFSGSATFKGQFKFHAPHLFNHLLKQDANFVDLEQSMDFDKNADAIREARGADGGRSGEFFFFSSDKKIIVKTISSQQMHKLLEILPQYVDYFEDHRDSLIAKIYGVFTMIREGIYEEEHFVVMRNVCGLPKKFVERDYDLKGSTVDRETLKGLNLHQKSELNGRGNLKDIDFLKYENQLHIEPKLVERFISTIQRDANFFRERNLIDYSLAVFIVNKKAYFEEFGQLPSSAFYHDLCSLENVKEEGICYNLGIIDYLQPYNFLKKTEKNFKRIIKLDPHLDTSVQPPDIYAERFSEFARRVIGQI